MFNIKNLLDTDPVVGWRINRVLDGQDFVGLVIYKTQTEALDTAKDLRKSYPDRNHTVVEVHRSELT